MTTHWSPDNFDNLGWQPWLPELWKKAPSQWQPSDNFWVVMVTTFGPSFALRVVKKGTVTVTTLTTQKWSIMTTFWQLVDNLLFCVKKANKQHLKSENIQGLPSIHAPMILLCASVAASPIKPHVMSCSFSSVHIGLAYILSRTTLAPRIL